MARALDFGGVYEKGPNHPTETVVPAALALGEREGITGRDLIVAITVGLDLTCRLKLVARSFKGFVGESIFGAAAAASRILQLDKSATLHSLAIAFCLASGTYQIVQDNNSYMHVSHGMKASLGILSAFFARQGVTGPLNFLEGEYGLYNFFENREDCEITELTNGLGRRFESANISIKPYPSCRFTHAAIDATLQLIEKESFHAEDVAGVTVGVNSLAHKSTCIPKEKKSCQAVASKHSLVCLF